MALCSVKHSGRAAGTDLAVCVTLAYMLSTGGALGRHRALRGSSVHVTRPDNGPAAQANAPCDGPASGHSVVTKLMVRQQLAQVCQRHPDARPTRGNLKQVVQYLRSATAEQW